MCVYNTNYNNLHFIGYVLILSILIRLPNLIISQSKTKKLLIISMQSHTIKCKFHKHDAKHT